jgi:hypothetical protein
MIASVRSLNRRTSSRPATTAGASRAELTITPQPAPAPSPQPRPAPTGRALLLKPAAQGVKVGRRSGVKVGRRLTLHASMSPCHPNCHRTA